MPLEAYFYIERRLQLNLQSFQGQRSDICLRLFAARHRHRFCYTLVRSFLGQDHIDIALLTPEISQNLVTASNLRSSFHRLSFVCFKPTKARRWRHYRFRQKRIRKVRGCRPLLECPTSRKFRLALRQTFGKPDNFSLPKHSLCYQNVWNNIYSRTWDPRICTTHLFPHKPARDPGPSGTFLELLDSYRYPTSFTSHFRPEPY